MTVFEMINLRFEFEEIVRNFTVNKYWSKHGTLDSMKSFLISANKHNRFRPGFARAEEICKMIIDHEEKRVPFA